MSDRQDDRQDDQPTEIASEQELRDDMSFVHSDDEYLDLLGGANLDDQDAVPDDELSALLLSWRRDVEAEPVGELVDSKLATMTVQTARVRRRRRPRLLVPVAAAAAVLAIAFAGFGLAARDAHPGDTLWALTKVFYADHARSVEAAQAVRADLHQAEVALTEGNLDVAKSKLEDAHATLPTVSPEEGQADLEKQHASLLAQLPGNPSGEASSPPSPDPTTAPDPGSSGGSDSSETTDPVDTSPSSPPDEPTDTTDPTTPPTTTSEQSRSGTQEEPGDEPAGVAPLDPPPDASVTDPQPPAQEPVN